MPDQSLERAEKLLPAHIRRLTEKMPERRRIRTEEIRLRIGRAPSLVLPEGEEALEGRPVSAEDLVCVLEAATSASLYAAADSLRSGYITAPGGYRIGICGSGVMKNGELTGLRHISSLAIRIPHEVLTAADDIADELQPGRECRSMLILSPPGGGKTTLLRDIVRRISSGPSGVRVALADERSEVAAVCGGVPQLNVGVRTDVIDACPKAQAVMMLVRSMRPEVIAMDEITAPEDISAIEAAANCGVGLLATAHAGGIADLRTRPLYRRLLSTGIFTDAAVIERAQGKRRCRIAPLDAAC